MKSNKSKGTYVAFLRGINVGGHHKVPMAELRAEMQKLKFENVLTLLNSGNIVFDAFATEPDIIEKKISEHLEKTFGFPIPTIMRKAEKIDELISLNPFKDIVVTKDIRLYVSLLRKDIKDDFTIPWSSDDKSFRIIGKSDKTIFSVLDLARYKTPKAMEALERQYGKDITTRNWKTIIRIKEKLDLHTL